MTWEDRIQGKNDSPKRPESCRPRWARRPGPVSCRWWSPEARGRRKTWLSSPCRILASSGETWHSSIGQHLWKNVSIQWNKRCGGAYNGVRDTDFRIDVQYELGHVSPELGNILLQPKTCHYIIWKKKTVSLDTWYIHTSIHLVLLPNKTKNSDHRMCLN